MKKIGIIGGLGPEATVDYYKEIVDGIARRNLGKFNNPDVIIYSVNMAHLLTFLEAADYESAADYIASKIHMLEAAGADFAVLSANTPHLFFDAIKSRVNIPLISIVETCAQKAESLKLKKLALLGTKFTMKNDFYPLTFQAKGLEAIPPTAEEIAFINEKLFNELEIGIFKEETRQELLQIVERMKTDHAIDGVILGCTEFPLMFDEASYSGLPFLNTTRIHVEAILEACLAPE